MSVLKKSLAVFLCMAILCTSVRFTTGKSLFVQEAEAVAPLIAVAGTSGAISGVATTISAALIPLATLFGGSGIFVDTTSQLVSDLQTIFGGFSDTAKEELETVGNAALDSATSGEWTPSELLLNEFEALVKTHLFNEDGSLSGSGLTSALSLPAFSDDMIGYFDALPAGFTTTLSTVPAYVSGTNLTVQLVSNPFDSVDYPALRIVNTSTGRSMIMDLDNVGAISDFMNTECGATYYISSPYVRGDTSDLYGVGFYVCSYCPVAAGGEYCENHSSSPYWVRSFCEGYSASSFVEFKVDGFNTWYDGVTFASQYGSGVDWTWETATGSEVDAGGSALSAVMAETSFIRKLINDVLEVPEVGTTMYLPALEDMQLQLDTLTQAAVLQNDWSKTIADYLAVANENTAETNSWLEKIYGAITGAIDLPSPVAAVVDGLVTPVVDVVSGFWNIVPDGFIINGVTNLFDGVNGLDIYEFWRHEEDINAIFG